jgi:hypothetical protein
MWTSLKIDLNNIALFFIAIFNAFTAWVTWRTHKTTTEVKKATLETQANVAIVEKATNSMKDALVAATGQAAHAAGVTEGLAQASAEKAVFDAGAKSQQEKDK